jgi:hypothetical protein
MIFPSFLAQWVSPRSIEFPESFGRTGYGPSLFGPVG